MNEKTLKLLEFDVIQSRVASCSMSAEASAIILSEYPLTDSEEARHLKGLVAACLKRMNSGDEEKRTGIPDIGEILPRLDVEGAVLELDEAYALAVFIEQGEMLSTWIGKNGSGPGENPLAPFCQELPDTRAVAAGIFRVIDREGNLRDLPEFREIRRRIAALSKDLETAGSRYTAVEETRRMLQSLVPSQRDGRMVLAVKANFRGRIKGIVHEVSSTGQTLFVEPEEVVEKNNDLLIEKRRLDAEIRRVLRELTKAITVEKTAIRAFHSGVLFLETIRTKARYGFETRGVFAREGEELILKKARHPLLGPSAIPLDFSLAKDKHTVIITGPNTGGKTVALKTAGLLAMMNQSGLPLPVLEGTTLPFFDGVFADIGDEQSLSQSLSTFSSHMTTIADILSRASSRSLVLLDELGSGTDPEEGSAIAMALIDHLMELKARLIVTTHHGILKNYGYTRAGAENASMEFDGKTLAPTFRVVMGIPGESRALDIALRNGLSKEIVSKARAYLAEEQADISALIEGLRKKHRELDAARDAEKREEADLREERRKADLRELSLRQKELLLKRDNLGLFRGLLEESRKQLENLIREIKEGEITREKTLKVKEFLSGLEDKVTTENAGLKREEEELRERRLEIEQEAGRYIVKPGKQGSLGSGTEVLAGEFRRKGRVLRQDKGKKGGEGKTRWIVEIGSLKMSFDEKDLIPLEDSGGLPPAPNWVSDLAPTEKARMEINLRGMRQDEALLALQKQVDAAVLEGLSAFSVVHGKGDGILQKAVHDFLKNLEREKIVSGYSFSRPEQGGFGRTEVFLGFQ